MKIIRGLNNIGKFKNPVVALGVFDGLHLGHKRILQEAAAMARRIRGKSIVVTLWPHPQKKESLYSLDHRLRLIAEEGIDAAIVLNFNRAFARISAEDFVKNILIRKLKADYVYIGKNFRFGKNAEGNFRTLSRLSRKYNFKLKVYPVVTIKNKAVSSTYIRALIRIGDIKQAAKLLTRPVSILGTVIRGSFLARKLGFPTANINPHHEVVPPSGIYAVRVFLEGGKFNGLCYIGSKPTFGKQKNKKQKIENIEVYILNFNRKIYRKYLEIQFIRKIREEKKFVSARQLIAQIKKDISASKVFFSRH